MNMKRLSILCWALLLFFTQALPQTAHHKKVRTVTILGRVVDSFTHLCVLDAKITIMTSDSVMVDTCRTVTWNEEAIHPDAYFYLQEKLSEGTYIFKIEHPDYQTTYINHELLFKGRQSSMTLDDMPIQRKRMEDKEHTLDEVVVKSTKIKMVMKGDTLVFNAEAFNLPQGSMLDALIRQLPGATLNSHGEIFINGRKLDYLTLNGKDFFKKDSKTLIENLPSYTVKDLQVFEKSTEKSKALGVDVEKKDYVMDIQLKKEYEKNFIANADIAGGTNSRYATKLFGLYFNPRLQMSVFANLNNVNEDRKPGEKGDWDPTKMPYGQVTQKTVGLNFATSNDKNTIKDNVSTSVSWKDSHDVSQTATESFLNTGNNSYSRSVSESSSKNFETQLEHQFQMSKPFWLRVENSLTYRKSDNWSILRAGSFKQDPAPWGDTQAVLDTLFTMPWSRRVQDAALNRQQNQSLGEGYSFQTSNRLYGTYPLKSGDNIFFQGYFSYNNTKRTAFEQYRLEYLQSATAKDQCDRYDDTPSHRYEYNAFVGYTYQLPSGWSFIPGVSFNQQMKYTNNSKYRLDRLQEWQQQAHELGTLPSSRDALRRAMDSNNSYQGYLKTQTQELSLNINYLKKSGRNSFYTSLNIPVQHEKHRLDYRSTALNTNISQQTWKTTSNLNIGATYNQYSIWAYGQMRIDMPDLYSKIDRRDDSNPLAISLGNPNLKNTTIYFTMIHFADQHNRRYKWPTLDFGLNVQQNAIANGFTFNPTTGVYTYKPQNVKGNWAGTAGIYYNCPLDSAKYFTLDNKLVYGYNRNVDLTAVEGHTESVLSKVNNHWTQNELSLNYQKEGATCSLVGSLGWRNVNSRRENFHTINAYDFNYGIVGSYHFGFGLETGMDLKMFSRRGYDDPSFNTDDWVCNAYLSQSFCKGKLSAKLEAYDLFQQLKNVSYEVNGQGKTETRFNTIPHYVMLHLMYKLNISGKKK